MEACKCQFQLCGQGLPGTHNELTGPASVGRTALQAAAYRQLTVLAPHGP